MQGSERRMQNNEFVCGWGLLFDMLTQVVAFVNKITRALTGYSEFNGLAMQKPPAGRACGGLEMNGLPVIRTAGAADECPG